MRRKWIFCVFLAVIAIYGLLFASGPIREKLASATINGALLGAFLGIAIFAWALTKKIWFRNRRTPQQQEADRRTKLGYASALSVTTTDTAPIQREDVQIPSNQSPVTAGEIKWFRLTLVVAGLFIVCAGLAWSYNSYYAYSERSIGMHLSSLVQQNLERCWATHRDENDCTPNGPWSEGSDRSFQFAEEYQERAEVAQWFLWLPATVLVALFYAIRWALCGRVRPLWLLKIKK